VDPSVSRRGTCDRGIWTKSLAFAADAEELILLYGFSMAVSPFVRRASDFVQIIVTPTASETIPFYETQNRIPDS